MSMVKDKDTVFFKTKIFEMIEIEPSRCQPWKYHNRDTAWLTKELCHDLIVSIKKHGQNEPALVRKAAPGLYYDYELIYGVRRWFACSEIPNQKLLVRVTEANDKDCMILMHSENAYSKDISEFERAFSFTQQMKSGMFKNQTEMAEAMGLTQGTISKMIKAGGILEYDWIKPLFQNKLDIPVKYAYLLTVLLKNPAYANQIKAETKAIQQEMLEKKIFFSATTVLKRMINCVKSQSQSYTLNESIVLETENKPIVSCRRDKLGKVTIFIQNEAKALNRSEVEAACLKVLDNYVF